MIPRDPYNSWLEKKRRIEADGGLTDRIMNRIANAEVTSAEPAFARGLARLIEWVSLRPWMQAVALLCGLTLGIFHLLAAIQFLLSY